MTSAGRAINAYVNTGIESGVPDADAHRLVLMLFEGALTAIAEAKLRFSLKDIPGRGAAISKAIGIVEQGLRGSLDTQKGGEIGERLDGLYEYICARLLESNMRAEPRYLDEVAALLKQLHTAWAEIRPVQLEMA